MEADATPSHSSCPAQKCYKCKTDTFYDVTIKVNSLGTNNGFVEIEDSSGAIVEDVFDGVISSMQSHTVKLKAGSYRIRTTTRGTVTSPSSYHVCCTADGRDMTSGQTNYTNLEVSKDTSAFVLIGCTYACENIGGGGGCPYDNNCRGALYNVKKTFRGNKCCCPSYTSMENECDCCFNAGL